MFELAQKGTTESDYIDKNDVLQHVTLSHLRSKESINRVSLFYFTSKCAPVYMIKGYIKEFKGKIFPGYIYTYIYTTVHLNIAWENPSFELFDLPFDR